MAEKEKDNPGIPIRVAVLETKVESIEENLSLLVNPKDGLFKKLDLRLDRIETSLKVWPKIIGLAVSILTVYQLLKAAGIVP